MNDISSKIVEPPKVQAGSETLVGGVQEADPLAIEDAVLGTGKVPVERAAEKADEKAVTCDENAKEKVNECDNGSGAGGVVEQTKNEELNEDNRLENIPEVVTESKKDDESAATVSEPMSSVEKSPQENPTEPLVPKPDTPKTPPIPIVQKPVLPSPLAAKPVVEASPPNDKPMVDEERKEKAADVEMSEPPPVEPKVETEVENKVETKSNPQPMNGDVAKEDQGTKRRASEDIETESPLKKLCQDVEKTFPQHDAMINSYIDTATKNNVDEIQRHTEQLLAEIQTLRELAQKKEHEWNNILHLKKVKEQILLRLLRRKQVIAFEKSPDLNGSDRTDPFDYLNQAKTLAIDKSDEISGLSLKQPGSAMTPIMQPVLPPTTHFNPMAGLPPPYDKAAHMQAMPKPVFHQPMMMPGHMPGFPRDMNGQLPSFGLPMGRQGPTKDVKSIIADYRQRNPDMTPRRGRRMKSILNPNMMNAPRPIAPKVDGMNNLNNLNMLFNNLDMNQKAMLERLQQMQGGGLPNGLSFKDVLVQFANMQQSPANLMPNRPPETITNRPEPHPRPEPRRRPERNHEELHVSVKQAERLASPSPRLPPPPPYPEISLLPVTSSQESSQQNSLLHGILTKNCGEITITPVQPTPPPAPDPQPEKTEEVVQLDDEESPQSEGEASGSPSGSGSGRLVIDEGTAAAAEAEASGAGAADAEEAPLCQGCKRRDAQFVCAGCANQWYCSRECQVAAWDEHSDMCSG